MYNVSTAVPDNEVLPLGYIKRQLLCVVYLVIFLLFKAINYNCLGLIGHSARPLPVTEVRLLMGISSLPCNCHHTAITLQYPPQYLWGDF